MDVLQRGAIGDNSLIENKINFNLTNFKTK